MLRKQQNPSAVPEDVAVLRHRPHALPWEFGTRETGVTGLIPCFVSTTVLLHLLTSCVIYLLSPRQEWEKRTEWLRDAAGEQGLSTRRHRDAGEGCTGDTVLCPRKMQINTPTATLTCIFPQGGTSSEDWGNPTASLDFLGRLEDRKGTCLHLSL